MQTDLGLAEWLRDNVTASNTGKIKFATDYSDGPLKTNVISHEIKFSITTTGNVTPGWKLTRFLINQSGNFFSATRDRTNDLTITLGPTIATPHQQVDANGKPMVDPQGKPVVKTTYAPSPPAADAAFTSQIGVSITNALKGGTLP